ncbi:MAG: response regulator [Alphaproteobacteria bacterium]|nr:response regulator [Alphaproteobacteria bacterium]NCQ66353.1 response regulator [Alphaproteobacteria bacterium]NCT06839.1 response regulator [Alphaproteobacteria bacterium]
MISEKTNVLFIENNDMDFELAKRAFRLAKLNNRILRHATSEAVLDMLKKNTAGTLKSKERPNLIFLDLNMPDLNGQEVLRIVRADKTMQNIPVIILSGQGDQNTIDALYKTGANSFMVKPGNLDELIAFFRLIREYWFKVMKLPTAS